MKLIWSNINVSIIDQFLNDNIHYIFRFTLEQNLSIFSFLLQFGVEENESLRRRICVTRS